ncbi:hypothetical protein [Kitasatospora aureofaciens]|uniref:hypothetical protein n=1 Tax=Kitasatospora aureofaciens TaxID=1894 RepID=UPI0037FADAD6
MTDSTSSTTPLPEGPDHGPEEIPELAPKRRRAARLRAWAGGRERRIVAGVAAVALVGAGGLALAVAHEEHGRGHHGAMNWAEDGGEHGRGENGGDEQGSYGSHGSHGARGSHDSQGSHDENGKGGKGGRHHGGQSENGDGTAPAPLPSLAASTALEKAQAAVPGGRAESLKRVTAQGGTAAWAVVVVGPDGVRHLVTVDGASGELTGNTVVGSTVDASLDGSVDGSGR